MHNLYNAYRQMYEALGVKNINRILPRPAPQGPKDPALEHIDALYETFQSNSWSRSQSTYDSAFKFYVN